MFYSMALWSSIKFQDLTSFTSSLLESLHDVVMVWLLVILSVVCLVSGLVMTGFKSQLYSDSLVLETVWTIIPIFILVLIAFPSLWLLCTQDSFIEFPASTLKVISNQWNWQSESEEVNDHLLDSDSTDLSTSYEMPVLLKSGIEARVITVSTDVLHSLGVPSLGIKLDTAPGRMSATTLESLAPGMFNGFCYELCGSGHSAMPISILIVY